MEFIKLRLSLSQVFQHPVSDCVMQLGFFTHIQHSPVTRPRLWHHLGLSVVSGDRGGEVVGGAGLGYTDGVRDLG